jgi:hypothetical protein
LPTAETRRRVALVLLGVAAFLLKPAYRGPLAEVVHAYSGNVTVSFALYFLASIAAARHGLGRFAAAGAALLAVEVFEITNGFGVMANVYDPVDLVANAAGVGIALGVDALVERVR